MENVAREGLAAVFHMDLQVWNFVQVSLMAINVNYFFTMLLKDDMNRYESYDYNFYTKHKEQ